MRKWREGIDGQDHKNEFFRHSAYSKTIPTINIDTKLRRCGVCNYRRLAIISHDLLYYIKNKVFAMDNNIRRIIKVCCVLHKFSYRVYYFNIDIDA